MPTDIANRTARNTQLTQLSDRSSMATIAADPSKPKTYPLRIRLDTHHKSEDFISQENPQRDPTSRESSTAKAQVAMTGQGIARLSNPITQI